jgi:hypothetical protein
MKTEQCETENEEIIEAFNILEPPMRASEQTAFPWVSGQEKEKVSEMLHQCENVLELYRTVNKVRLRINHT